MTEEEQKGLRELNRKLSDYFFQPPPRKKSKAQQYLDAQKKALRQRANFQREKP